MRVRDGNMSKFEDIGVGKFRETLKKVGGNLTKAATIMGVSRSRLYYYCREVPEWGQAVKDERGSLLDECLISARVLALGIPEKDANGAFVGWIERPDGNMLRYLISTLGRKEGFGEQDDDGASDGSDRIDGFNVHFVETSKEEYDKIKNKEKK